ncbi:Neuroligin-3-like protein, partial [Leptotrombidium deliense]
MSSSSVRRHHHLQQTAQRSQSASQSASGRTPESGLRSFFYVFSYQSENSGFTQRLGCHHGEELAYVFGAPLAADLLGRSIGHFSINSSKQEVTLSEA